MSDNIREYDVQEGREVAWHGKTLINSDLSLGNVWLGTWDILSKPLFVPMIGGDGGDTYTKVGWEILYASDNPGVLIGKPFNPESYSPVTNAEFLELARKSTEGCPVKLVSAGSLRNRGRVFLSFESEMLPIYKAGGREFKPFINFGNGHDQSCTLWTNNSCTCTVCDNTFSLNLADVMRTLDAAKGSRQRHTKNIQGRLPAMAECIKSAILAQETFAAAFEKMAETPISGVDAVRLFTGFVAEGVGEKKNIVSTRAANIIGKLVDLFKGGRGNRGENLADVFSGATDYYTHESAGGRDKAQRQFQSSEFGTGAERKQELFRVLTNPEKRAELIELGANRIQATEAHETALKASAVVSGLN